MLNVVSAAFQPLGKQARPIVVGRDICDKKAIRVEQCIISQGLTYGVIQCGS